MTAKLSLLGGTSIMDISVYHDYICNIKLDEPGITIGAGVQIAWIDSHPYY